MPSVVTQLQEQGALVVDLRLCGGEALSAVCAFLREAPCVRQVVLRDGLMSLGADSAYRERAAAYQRRQTSGVLAAAAMRLLISALAAFLTVRGGKVEVLDLTGVPLGKDIAAMLTPLVRGLRSGPLQQLRWLGLTKCNLGDQGLSLLLPWLAGKDHLLLHLQALLLASNGLSDVQLIDALLRSRARLCFQRRAAPLQLLDLSGNPRLGERQPAAGKQTRRASSYGTTPRSPTGAGERVRGGRGVLVRVLARALAEGLPLRALRLRQMHLDEDALQPLLRLISAETQRCLASGGVLAKASGFCLEQLDLFGNLLVPAFVEDVAEGLRLLQTLREVPWEAPDLEQEPWAEAPPKFRPGSRRRARSVPCCVTVPTGPGFCTASASDAPAPRRDALSDGPGSESEEVAAGDAPRSREAFLLQRAEDKRQFRAAAVELSERQQAAEWRRWQQDPEREMSRAIGSSLGPMSADSIVRRAFFEELRSGGGAPSGVPPPESAGAVAAHGGAGLPPAGFSPAEWQDLLRGDMLGHAGAAWEGEEGAWQQLPPWPAAAQSPWLTAPRPQLPPPLQQQQAQQPHWKQQPPQAQFPQQSQQPHWKLPWSAGPPDPATLAPGMQPFEPLAAEGRGQPDSLRTTAEEIEAAAEQYADMLRYGRLEELRAAVFDAGVGTKASLASPGHGDGGGAQPFTAGGLADRRLDELHRTALQHLWQRVAPARGGGDVATDGDGSDESAASRLLAPG